MIEWRTRAATRWRELGCQLAGTPVAANHTWQMQRDGHHTLDWFKPRDTAKGKQVEVVSTVHYLVQTTLLHIADSMNLECSPLFRTHAGHAGYLALASLEQWRLRYCTKSANQKRQGQELCPPRRDSTCVQRPLLHRRLGVGALFLLSCIRRGRGFCSRIILQRGRVQPGLLLLDTRGCE